MEANLEFKQSLYSLVCNEASSHHLMEELRHKERYTQEELNQSLYHAVTELGNLKVVKLLLTYGADWKTVNNNGDPLLISVVQKRRFDILDTLVSFGYDVNYNLQNSESFSSMPLCCAIKFNEYKIVELLLSKNCRIDLTDRDGNNSLHFASSMPSSKSLKLLLQTQYYKSDMEGSRLNMKNSEGDTALHLAIKHNSEDSVKKLLSIKEIDVNAQNNYGNTPLMTALTIGGSLHLADMLLKFSSCDITMKNCNGRSALHFLAEHADISLIDKYVEMGLSTYDTDCDGNTVFSISAARNREALFCHLVEKYILHTSDYYRESIKRKGFCGRTALHWLAINAMFDSLRMLLQNLTANQVDINCQDVDGNTALLLAAFYNNYKEFELLLQYKADTSVQNTHGVCVLHYVCEHGHIRMLQRLLSQRELNINQTAAQTNLTALHKAAMFNKTEAVKVLLSDSRLDLEIAATANEVGSTILHNAVSHKNVEMITTILSYSAFKKLLKVRDNNGCSPLLIAAKDGPHKEIISLLLQTSNGECVNDADNSHKSALYYCVYHQDKSAARILLTNGAKTAHEHCHTSALILACSYQDPEMIHLILEYETNINRTDMFNKTAFMQACQSGHLAIAKVLAKIGTDAKHRDDSGDTALTLAANAGHVDVVDYLLPLSNVDNVEENGMSALQLGLFAGHIEIAEKLISYGADVNQVACTGDTVLITAVSMECGVDIVKSILATGRLKNLNAVGEMGRTAVHWAVSDHESLIELLKYSNAKCEALDIDIVDENGASPLLLSVAHSKHESAIALLSAGCKYDTIYSDGRHIIHHAAIYGELEVLLMLLFLNVNPTILTEDGRSPILLASIEGHAEIVQELIKHGARVNQVFCDAVTPLSVAVSGSHYNTIDVLLKAGAIPDLVGERKPRPVICAIMQDCIWSVKTLLQWGCDVESCTDQKKHPITVAAIKQRKQILNLLLTALGDTNVVRRILKEGAIYYFVQDQDILSSLKNFVQSPVTLKQLCRSVIRKVVQIPVKINVYKLHVPVMMKHYIVFEKADF